MSAGQLEKRPSAAVPRPEPSRRRRRAKPPDFLLGITPVLALYVVGFAAPLVYLGYQSTQSYSPATGVSGGGSLQNYTDLAHDHLAVQSLVRTLVIGLVVVAVCAVLGYVTSVALMYQARWVKTVVIFCVIAPLLVNGVVRTFGWMLLFQRGGLVERVTGQVLLNTNAANVIGLANLFVAYMVLSLIPAMNSVSRDVLRAARSLGASELRILCRLVLPISFPGLISGGVIVFGAACGSVITPFLLGGSSYNVITVLIFRNELILANPVVAAALSIVLLVIAGALAIATERTLRRRFLRWQA